MIYFLSENTDKKEQNLFPIINYELIKMNKFYSKSIQINKNFTVLEKLVKDSTITLNLLGKYSKGTYEKLYNHYFKLVNHIII